MTRPLSQQGKCARLYRPALFPATSRQGNDGSPLFNFRLQWKTRRWEIDLLAEKARAKADAAKRIPVLADVTLLRCVSATVLNNLPLESAEQPVPPPHLWLCLTQMWIQKTSMAYPPSATTVGLFLGYDLHHKTQLSLGEFAAFHLRETMANLDGFTVARTIKLMPEMQKLKAEIEGRRN